MFSKLAAKQFDTVQFPSLKRGRKTLQGVKISKALKHQELMDARYAGTMTLCLINFIWCMNLVYFELFVIVGLAPVESICCCHKQCMDAAIPSYHRRQQLRDEYFNFKNDVDRKQWLKDTFLFGFQDDDDVELKQFNYLESRLCWSSIKWHVQLLGCSNNLLASAKGTNQSRATTHTFRPSRVGVTLNSHASGAKDSMFNKRDHIAMWLNEQKAFYCMQPDKDEVLLPFAFKREVWEEYCGQNKSMFESLDPCGDWLTCTEQYFKRVWRADVPTLKCKKYHWFQLCDLCIGINEKLQNPKLSPANKKLWKDAKARHLQDVREDRYGYELRILQAKNSENIMSATIDGSDNGEYGFPYWADKTKQTDKGYKIKSKLYAMLVHNIGVYTYVFNAHLPGGTNVTINVLHHTLTKMKEEEVQFAPILHLQLDNTVKDNKSKFVMAYLQALVDCGVFEEITVHFFQVGHTHCDIDQLFSRIAIYLKVSAY